MMKAVPGGEHGSDPSALAALEFERYKFDREWELKSRELDQKDREASKSGRGLNLTAAQGAAAGALFAMLGAVGGALVQYKSAQTIEYQKGQSAVELDRQKFETSLIQHALESPDEDVRISSLHFLSRAGLVQDKDGKIIHLIATELPTLSKGKPTMLPFTEFYFTGIPKSMLDYLASSEKEGEPYIFSQAMNVVDELIKPKITQNQRTALVALAYRIGTDRFRRSNLVKCINEGKRFDTKNEFLQLVFVDQYHDQSSELAIRNEESTLFNRPD